VRSIQIDEALFLAGSTEPEPADFINHSCDPNCGMRGNSVLVALRDIEPGEELGYDYGYERTEDMGEEEEKLYVCRCGAATCRGTILAPPPKPKARKQASSTKKAEGASGDGKAEARGKARSGDTRAPQPKKPGGSRRRTSSASLA
jgi:hypothetical protein